MSSFIAIDVETANPDLGSICQVGLVRFAEDGSESRWASLIDPEDEFSPFHVGIHGIDEAMVAGAPTFAVVHEALAAMLDGQVLVCHTHFDRVALQRACERYRLPPVRARWLDSARVVRCAWPDRYARAGYGLASVARDLGIEYRAHDALEDAWTAGRVLLHAIEATGLSVADWLERVRRPIFPPASAHEPNPDGPLAGEVICFTGKLSIPRREAGRIAAAAGCVVASSVTMDTTLLVVGDQDIRRLAGHQRSSKHRKAERLIAEGHPIRILTERDFQKIAGEAWQNMGERSVAG